jgi:hypothetical protein
MESNDMMVSVHALVCYLREQDMIYPHFYIPIAGAGSHNHKQIRCLAAARYNLGDIET